MRLYEGENRAMRSAVLASIALHALLLFAWPGWRDTQRWSVSREPLIARLQQPRVQPVAAQAPAIPETRKPDPAPAAKPPRRANAVRAPAPTPPVAQVASATSDLPRTEPGLAAPATAVGATPSVASVTAGTTQSAPAAEEALDAGTLAQYRLAIITAARRYKRYPRAALDNNWQGKVEIRMAIGANGAIAALSVRSGTGHPVLDQQALEMIERAKDMAQIPASLRGQEFVVDIPVIFSLLEPGA